MLGVLLGELLGESALLGVLLGELLEGSALLSLLLSQPNKTGGAYAGRRGWLCVQKCLRSASVPCLRYPDVEALIFVRKIAVLVPLFCAKVRLYDRRRGR